MNKVGLIGGIGPESTVSYYRKINKLVKEQLGEHYLPKLSIETLNAFEVFSFCKEHKYDELADYVLAAVQNLAAAGAKYAALTGNTPNIALDVIREKSPIPLISAIDATVDVARSRNVKTIGLLGTIFTMSNSFFKTPFENHGIEVHIPTKEQIQYIQSRIESELEHGVVTEETTEGFINIINDMKIKHNIEQIILGCTELPLILNDSNSPVPCLDTVDIHVKSIVDIILKKNI